MELRQLRYFLKAKELVNFTEAATHLCISQSTLSQQIKQLENELGVLLFERVGKRIQVTEAGELFSHYALQTITSAESGSLVLKDLNELNVGELIIGVTYGLKDLLTASLIEFSRLHPNIKVQVIFSTSHELTEKLERFELDFVLSFQEVIQNQQHYYQPLFQSPLCLVVSKDAPLARKKTIRLSEIKDSRLALPAKGFSTRQFVNNAIQNDQVSLNISIEINDITTLLELVKTGDYCTILAKSSVNDSSNLTTIPIKGKSMIRQAVIISMKERYEKKSTVAFYKVIHRLKD